MFQTFIALIPTEGKVLKPIKINESEKTKKPVKVTSKTTISKGRTQIGFHDGRSIISDTASKRRRYMFNTNSRSENPRSHKTRSRMSRTGNKRNQCRTNRKSRTS